MSATAFHWVDQDIGHRKVADLLRKGGIWAMWWNIFGDSTRPDPFHQATNEILKPLERSPSHGSKRQSHFALDKDARIADILNTGRMIPVRFEIIPWTITLNTTQLRSLYATFSPIQRQDVESRQRILDAVSAVAENKFGGIVKRPMTTAIYLARRK